MSTIKSAETKERILRAAETCFAANGYDGSGIEEISETAGTNKALIYYHFKNKEGLLLALYEKVLGEVEVLLSRNMGISPDSGREEMKENLRGILRFLTGKKNLLKILLMESLKGGSSETVFMKLAKDMMENEVRDMEKRPFPNDRENMPRFLVFEFFTGFVPMYVYAVFEESLPGHFGLDRNEAEEYFIDSFIRTHLSHHDL